MSKTSVKNLKYFVLTIGDNVTSIIAAYNIEDALVKINDKTNAFSQYDDDMIIDELENFSNTTRFDDDKYFNEYIRDLVNMENRIYRMPRQFKLIETKLIV